MFKKLFKKRNKTAIDIMSPATGTFVNLDDVPDPVFSAKMVGDGAAVQPEKTKTVIVSPVKGKVVMLADSLHAIGICGENDVELLIHVGLETVDLKGEGFRSLVFKGDDVESGQPLLEVDFNLIEESGKNSVIPVVITNNENNKFKVISGHSGAAEAGKTVLFSVEAQA